MKGRYFKYYQYTGVERNSEIRLIYVNLLFASAVKGK